MSEEKNEKSKKFNFEKITGKLYEYCGVIALFFIVMAYIITLNFSGEWGGILPDIKNIGQDLGLAILLIIFIVLSVKCLFMYLTTHGKTNLAVYYLTIIIYIIVMFFVLSPIINFFIR